MEPEEQIEVVNAPQEIWLCVGDLSDVITETVEFDELRNGGDVSWCNEQIEHWDVRYVRADCYDEREKEIGNAREALAAYGVGEGSLHQCIVRLALKHNQEIERLKGLLRDAADVIEDLDCYRIATKYREAGQVTPCKL